MKINRILIVFLLCFSFLKSQSALDSVQIKENLEKVITDLEEHYVYFQQKGIDVVCLKNEYSKRIGALKSDEDLLLFYEYLLDEFYDSHLHLSANKSSSYRMDGPIFSQTIGRKTFFIDYFKVKMITPIDQEKKGSEIIQFNGVDFQKMIDEFPTRCQDKTQDEVRSWIGNKVLAGRYNKPRIITLKSLSGEVFKMDLDSLVFKAETDLLSYQIIDNVGVISIHNSLGNRDLAKEFKQVIKSLNDTNGIILDLRNTPSGGNTNVANPIAGHFVLKKTEFQKYKNEKESFSDYISPHRPKYKKPLVILVGRYTGSMGEGLASGLNGIGRAKVVGTEMKKLAGATKFLPIQEENYGIWYPYIEVLQPNGKPRTDFVPDFVIETFNEDEVLAKGLRIINTDG